VVAVHAVRSPSGSVDLDLDLDLDLGTEGVACDLVCMLSVWVIEGEGHQYAFSRFVVDLVVLVQVTFL